MATMSEVVERVDGLKPNVYAEDDKYRWLAQLDGVISLEVYQQEEAVQYTLPQDADRALLIPPPFEDCYELYLSAMIDFYNREYNNYNNAVLMFQERYEAFKAWYLRNNDPSRARNFRYVMG